MSYIHNRGAFEYQREKITKEMKMKILIWLLTLSVQFLNVNSNACGWLNDGSDCVIQCSNNLLSSETSGLVQSVYNNVRY